MERTWISGEEKKATKKSCPICIGLGHEQEINFYFVKPLRFRGCLFQHLVSIALTNENNRIKWNGMEKKEYHGLH